MRRFLPRIQREVEERLLAGEFTSYRALSAELRRRGCHISKSALQRLGQKLQGGLVQPRKADRVLEEGIERDYRTGRR